LLLALVSLLVLAGALQVSAGWADWVGLGDRPALRGLTMLGVVGAGALAYGASLLLVGWRPKHLATQQTH